MMHYFFEWIAELLLMIFHFPLEVLKLILPLDSVIHSKRQETIILVERWFARNPLHFFLKRFLEKQGYEVYSINFPMYKDTFHESALQLKNYIESKNLKKITLIGLSNGGLTCYDYLENLNGWEITSKLITIATPFGGAILAFLLLGLQAQKELDSKGYYIQSVRSWKSDRLRDIYCIAAKHDQMVGHSQSFLPGAHHITIDVVGHNLVHTLWKPTWVRILKVLVTSS